MGKWPTPELRRVMDEAIEARHRRGREAIEEIDTVAFIAAMSAVVGTVVGLLYAWLTS